MIDVTRRFLRCCDGATAIEYAIMGSFIALVIVLALGRVGIDLSSSYNHIGAAFPSKASVHQ